MASNHHRLPSLDRLIMYSNLSSRYPVVRPLTDHRRVARRPDPHKGVRTLGPIWDHTLHHPDL